LFRSQSLTPFLAVALVAMALVAHAQVDILPPEILAKLDSANERPMALAPDGEPLRFRTGTERWEEAVPPGIIDIDRDGTKDYIVLIIADADSGRRCSRRRRTWPATRASARSA